MPTFVPKRELLAMSGHELEPSPWLVVDQERIDLFADATGDHQFIHVDPGKAARTPFGSTIAHGFLSLSLLPHLSESVAVLPQGMRMAINYGLNKVRFLGPVRVGSAVRLRSKILRVSERSPGRLLVSSQAIVEIRDEERPALIAETLALFIMAEEER